LSDLVEFSVEKPEIKTQNTENNKAFSFKACKRSFEDKEYEKAENPRNFIDSKKKLNENFKINENFNEKIDEKFNDNEKLEEEMEKNSLKKRIH